MPQTLHVELDGPVAFFVIDAPPLNLLTMDLRSSLARAALDVAGNARIRAVVIRSAHQTVFSAGSDVKEFPVDAADGMARAALEQNCFNAIAAMPQPVIAELRGHVLGGGLELALACDVRVADTSVRLALPESGLGVFPTGGGTQRLAQLVGPSRAKLLMLLGTSLDAAAAFDAGLVDEVVAEGDPSTAVHDLATRIAARPRRAAQAIKAAVDHGQRFGHVAGEAKEVELAALYGSADAAEGVRAFLESRAPGFGHQ
jgi:enoyl-CoA hydratase/carnithine racemase